MNSPEGTLRLIRHGTSSFKTDSRSVAPFKPDSRSVTRSRLYARPFEADSKLGHPKPTLARSLHGRPLARAFETYSSRRSRTFNPNRPHTKPETRRQDRRPRPISVARTFKTDSTLAGHPRKWRGTKFDFELRSEVVARVRTSHDTSTFGSACRRRAQQGEALRPSPVVRLRVSDR